MQKSEAQSIINPLDPVNEYDSTHKPTPPDYFHPLVKWVRTLKIENGAVQYRNPGWTGETNYKAYNYNGLSFRVQFPKSYNPAANDGKKYPIIIFLHGQGENDATYLGPPPPGGGSYNYDNEWQLLQGPPQFDNAIQNGTYDGYIIAPQLQNNISSSPTVFYQGILNSIMNIVKYMITNNKVDPYHIVVNGLSEGGVGCWDILNNFPTYFAAVTPMSAPVAFVDMNNTGNYFSSKRFTPIWCSQGGQDTHPLPSETQRVADTMAKYGANFKESYYPTNGHNTWYNFWGEPTFWPFINSAYSSNPWMVGGLKNPPPGQSFFDTIGLPPGFAQYQWRLNGNLISGATGNIVLATAPGVYDARVLRDSVWSDWSHVPINIRPGFYEAENYSNKSTNPQPELTTDVGGGYDMGYIGNGDWLDYSVTTGAAGNYGINLRLSSATGGQLQIKNSAGTVLATVIVPNTGGWQNWQTLSANIPLTAGTQTIRIYCSVPNWNINWFQISASGTTPPPPTVTAGPNQTITLPTNSVTLSGSATANNGGTITSYKWSQTSGPSTASIVAPSSASTTVNNLVQGTYVFALKATDNQGDSASSSVTITVNAASTGGGTIHIEAENYINSNSVATEPTTDTGGGLDVGYIGVGSWMDYNVNIASAGTYTMSFRIASPNSGTQFQVRNSSATVLATVNMPATGGWQTWQTITTTVTLPAGAQTIRLYATTNGWNINWFEIAGAGGTTPPPPTVSAGPNQTITLPTNSVTLSGSATANNGGTISSYQWSQTSGPSTASIVSPSSASTTVNNLVQGTYVFSLKVTDNQGNSASSSVTITVNAASTGGGTIHIEAENYIAMNSVVTESASDVGGGLDVGYIGVGSWMDYNVNIASAGTYTMSFRIASPNSGTQFQVRNSSATVLATVNMPATGGWQTWQTITTTVTLPAGAQTIRLYATTNGWNINWFEIAGAAATLTTQSMNKANQLLTSSAPFLGIYPNPVSSNLRLQIVNDFTGQVSVQVYNLLGVLQKQFSLSKPATGSIQYDLSLGQLAKGSYIVKVIMNNWTDSKQITKQ